jgi:CRISPR-associated protein Csa2
MVFLSLAARLEVNVEAFNAVETVGNLAKHRRAPMVVPTSGGYRLVYVPAVSGESLANAYQRALVEVARVVYRSEKLRPPLTEWDERCEFSKFMDNAHLTKSLRDLLGLDSKEGGEARKGRGRSSKQETTRSVQDLKHEFEKIAVAESIVADIGGFLYAEETPVKRTSRFYVGYLLPVYDALDSLAIEAQFHARHMPAETVKEREVEAGEEGEERARRAQMIYYVEVASAVYGLSFALDVSGIGVTSLVKLEEAVSREERARRVRVALGALQLLFTGVGFGAKLSRFTPVRRVISAIATVTHPHPFTVSPPQLSNYISETVRRIASYRSLMAKLGVTPEIRVVTYGEEVKSVEGVTSSTTLEEFFEKVTSATLDLFGKFG